MAAGHERMTNVPRKHVRGGRAGCWLRRGVLSLGLIAFGALGSQVLLRGEGTILAEACWNRRGTDVH